MTAAEIVFRVLAGQIIAGGFVVVALALVGPSPSGRTRDPGPGV